MSRTITKSGATKRKSDEFMPNGIVSRPVKQPRNTIDSYFEHSISVDISSGIEGASGKKIATKSIDITLTDEQQRVFKMAVEDGENVFFTGSAGTGKSILLKAIVAALKKKYAKQPDAISVTASTGMAGTNIGGQTVHAWGAIAPSVEDINKLERDIRFAKPALKRWKATQVLIIDEVSMVDGHLFDRIVKLATRLRKPSPKPCGGIQLILTGDFLQLPPVTKGRTEPFFAFESEAWSKCFKESNMIVLTKVFRQKERVFVDLLNELRRGDLSPETTKAFRELERPLPVKGFLPPTELFPLRGEVDEANRARLAALRTPPHVFHARDSGSASPEKRANVLANMIAPAELTLKVGAQVMLVRNIDDRRGLVNGSVGRVRGFFHAPPGKADSAIRDLQLDEDGTPIYCKEETKKEGERENKKPRSSSGGISDEKFPYVEFVTPQGKLSVLVCRDEFKVEDNEGKVIARRVQVPLILAWALSIHKSQGQTIQRVKVDLGRVFEKGQSYVALSRAASIEGLQVLGFSPHRVKAHPKVIEWYEKLASPSATPSSTPSDSTAPT